jgi:hypothetical protein
MKLKKKVVALVVLLVGMLLLQNAGASIVAPLWRDKPGSTYQEWTFSKLDNPAAPEISHNPGSSVASINATGEFLGFQPGWYPQFLGRTGVWCGAEITLVMQIPNIPIPNEYKEIWVEMEFRGELTEPITVEPSPGGVVTELGRNIINTVDGWRILNASWKIVPNPFTEEMTLHISSNASNVNYISADTICIPEPTIIALLGLGVMAVVRKR